MHPLKRGSAMVLIVLPTAPGNVTSLIIKLKQKILTLCLVQEMPLCWLVLYLRGHYSFIIPSTHRFLFC
jgi:hypothetical protein